MCGIIAVIGRRSADEPTDPAEVLGRLSAVREAVPDRAGDWKALAGRLAAAADGMEALNESLLGSPGLRCLIASPDLVVRLEGDVPVLEKRLEALEAELDAGGSELPPEVVEPINVALVRLKDALWAVGRDRLRHARAVAELAGDHAGRAATEAYAAIQTALSALDRLEVRGRDSAGLHVLVTGHDLDLADPDVGALLAPRLANRLFTGGAVRTQQGHLSFAYMAAAEIGELGDNSAALRRAIKSDELLRLALSSQEAEAVVLGHTRWASVGIISEANAHPLNSEESGRVAGPYVVAALNGDVDNHTELTASNELRIPEEITTDAKVIPILVSRRLVEGRTLEEAFRQTVAAFEGSVAICAQAAAVPDRLLLALRGSGQALYVGFAKDRFVVASEPYGLVEETTTYLRVDGETPADPDHASASRGQILLLDRAQAGSLEGVERLAYDGTCLPIEPQELQEAEITTRDVDRGTARHYLLKEISEAPRSFRKTLRGRIHEESGRLQTSLGEEGLPAPIRARLRRGELERIFVIGQGTAAIAGQGVAAAFAEAITGDDIQIRAMPATELSGFHLQDDMSDCLIVAISQSGTTTDTNRTVDLIRGRGAAVVSIVNRRNSDLTEKSDGVLYTSDGRDVEMSVASTKAFYAQIAAGFLLAFAVAREIGRHAGELEHDLISALRDLPHAMQSVLDKSEDIAKTARRHAPKKRYWALVGNGRNRIAAEEIRIKLSELCYKSIACDATEDKKHIDLSSEPLILVCAAGLSGSTADDVGKEVAIYRAHKAVPIVISTEGSTFDAAVEQITVPEVHPSLAFVLTTMAGHLFGYHAALAIDSLAKPLREARAEIESLVSSARPGDNLLHRAARAMNPCAARFFAGMREGLYDGHLEASTAVQLASLFRYVLGLSALDSYQDEHGKVGTPGQVIEDHTLALTRAIEELTRPVDAIKHQAKTVTVGISRADEALLLVPLVAEVLGAGAPRDRISYRDLRTLAALDPAMREVVGFTRYKITGEVDDGGRIEVMSSSGVADGLHSRTADDPRLKGTKHLVARERQVMVARGRSDDRTVVLVPEVQGHSVIGLTLLHVAFHDTISSAAMRGVLGGYRKRYAALKDAVTETEPSFDEDLLAKMSVVDLLTEPIHVLADRWRATETSRQRRSSGGR